MSPGPSEGRFAALDFEGFRRLALDESLSPHEKVGFPDSYRAGREGAILRDLRSKLTRLDGPPCRVLDVGPGCGPLSLSLIGLCGERGHRLDLVDSPEMLALLPGPDHVRKVEGRFPDGCLGYVEENLGALDAVLAYSVFQYARKEGVDLPFFDAALGLLAEGGQLLLGDLPNRSMRRRFFTSTAGRRHHREFLAARGERAFESEAPDLEPDGPSPGEIDDSFVAGLLLRARAAGFDAFVVPQSPDLPMANRREDLLVRRP